MATNSRSRRVYPIAVATALVAITSDVVFAAMGGGGITAQLDGAAPSRLLNLVKLPVGWRYVAAKPAGVARSDGLDFPC